MTQTILSASLQNLQTGLSASWKPLLSAKETAERLKDTLRNGLDLLLHLFDSLAKQSRTSAVNLTNAPWNSVYRQIDIVGRARRDTSTGCNRIGNRADGCVLQSDCRPERLRRIALRR